MSFVFRPGGTPGGNVYTSETALALATQALNGAPYSVLFDLSLVGGNYTFAATGSLAMGANGTWTDGGAAGTLTFANGTTLPSLPNLAGALNVRVTQTTPVVSLSSGRVNWTIEGLANIAGTSSSGPFLALSVTANPFVFLRDSGALGGPNNIAINASTVAITVQAQDDASLGANAIQVTASGGQTQVNACGAGVDVDPSLYTYLQVANLYVDLSGAGLTAINGTNQNDGAILFCKGMPYEATASGWLPLGSGA